MTASRAGCAARLLYRDQHMATDHQYHVTDPQGRQYVLCSGACLVSYAVLGALPADVANNAGSTVGDTTNAHAREAA